MKIKTDDLRAALSVIDNVAPNSFMDSSTYISLSAVGGKLYLKLTGILRASANVAIPNSEKWQAYIDRKMFRSFIGTASEEIEITYSDKQISLSAKQSLNVPTHAPIVGYEVWKADPKAKQVTVTSAHVNAIKSLSAYKPTAPGMEHVAAICFDAKHTMAFATDTIFMSAMTDKAFSHNWLLPIEAAGVVAKLATSGNTVVDKTGVGVQLTNGWIFQPQPTTLDSYPTTQCLQVLNNASSLKPLATVTAGDLQQVLKAATEFVTSSLLPMVIAADKNAVSISVDVHGGKFQRSVDAKVTGKVAGVQWPSHGVLPWVSEIAKIQEDTPIIVARDNNSTILRVQTPDTQRLLVFAEL